MTSTNLSNAFQDQDEEVLPIYEFFEDEANFEPRGSSKISPIGQSCADDIKFQAYTKYGIFFQNSVEFQKLQVVQANDPIIPIKVTDNVQVTGNFSVASKVGDHVIANDIEKGLLAWGEDLESIGIKEENIVSITGDSINKFYFSDKRKIYCVEKGNEFTSYVVYESRKGDSINYILVKNNTLVICYHKRSLATFLKPEKTVNNEQSTQPQEQLPQINKGDTITSGIETSKIPNGDDKEKPGTDEPIQNGISELELTKLKQDSSKVEVSDINIQMKKSEKNNGIEYPEFRFQVIDLDQAISDNLQKKNYIEIEKFDPKAESNKLMYEKGDAVQIEFKIMTTWVYLSSNGTKLYCARKDGQVHIYDQASDKFEDFKHTGPEKVFKEMFSSSIFCINMNKSESLMVISGQEKNEHGINEYRIKMYNPITGTLVTQFDETAVKNATTGTQEFIDDEDTIIESRNGIQTLGFFSKRASKIVNTRKQPKYDDPQYYRGPIESMLAYKNEVDGEIELYIGCGDGKILKKYGESDTVLVSKDRHVYEITALAMTSDGMYLASGDSQGNVYFHTFEKTFDKPAKTRIPEVYDKCQKTFSKKVSGLTFHPDNNLCIGLTTDKYFKFWELDQKNKYQNQFEKKDNRSPNQSKESGKNQPSLNQNDEEAEGYDSDNSGPATVTTKDEYLCAFQGKSYMFKGETNALCLAPNSLIFAVGDTQNIYVMDIFDPDDVKYVFENVHTGAIYQLIFTNMSDYIWSGSADGKIRKSFQEAEKPEDNYPIKGTFEEFEFLSSDDYIRSMALSQDEDTLAFGDDASILRIFDQESKKQKYQLCNAKIFHSHAIRAIVFKQNDNHLIEKEDDKIRWETMYTCGSDAKLFEVVIDKPVRLLLMKRPHEQEVNMIKYTPNGKNIVSVGDSLKVFDLNTKEAKFEKATAGSKSGQYWDMIVNITAIACTNRKIWTGDYKGEVQSYYVSNGDEHTKKDKDDEVIPYLPHIGGEGLVKVIEIAPCDSSNQVRQMAVVKQKDNTFHGKRNCIVIYNSYDGGSFEPFEFPDLDCDKINDISWTKDSKNQIVGSSQCLVKVLHVEQKTQLYTLKNVVRDQVFSLAITSSNEILACAGTKDIKFYDFAKRQAIFFRKDVHKDRISCMVISSDDKYLATSSYDKSVMLMDIENKTIIQYFHDAHYSNINHVQFSPDNQCLASCSNDKSIKVFDIGSELITKNFQTIFENYEFPNTVGFNYDINKKMVTLLAVSSTSQIKLVTMGQSKVVCEHYKAIHQGKEIWTLKFWGDYLVSGCEKNIGFINWKSRKHLFEYQDAHTSKINGIAFNTHRNYMATCSDDGNICQFDLTKLNEEQDKKKIPSIQNLDQVDNNNQTQQNPQTNAVNADDNVEKGPNDDQPIVLKRKYVNYHQDSQVSDCIFHPMLNLLITCGTFDSSVKIIDVKVNVEEEQKKIDELNEKKGADEEPEKLGEKEKGIYYDSKKNIHKTGIKCLAINKPGTQLATGGSDKTVKLINIKKLLMDNELSILHTFEGFHTDSISSIDISLSGKFLASVAGSDNNLIVFDLERKKKLLTVENIHTAYIRKVIFSEDEKFISTASDDKSIKIIGMDNYFNQGQVMMKLDEKTKPPSWTNKFQNPLKGYSFFTYKIWQEFILKDDTRFKSIGAYLAENPALMNEAYGSEESYNVTKIDLQAIFCAFTHLNIHAFQPNLLKAISENPNRPDFESLYIYLVDIIRSDKVDSKGDCVHYLFMNLFKKVDNLKFVNDYMIDEGAILYEGDSVDFEKDENCRRAFHVKAQEVAKLNKPCRVVRSTIDFNLYRPTKKNYRLLKLLYEEGLPTTFDEENVYNLIEYFWKKLKIQLYVYQGFYSIIILMLIAQSLWINEYSPRMVSKTTENAVNIAILVLDALFVLYEVIQAFATGNSYFRELQNYIDLPAFGFVALNSIYQLVIKDYSTTYSESGSNNVQLISFFDLALMFAFLKFYRNLNYIDSMRELASKLSPIFEGILPFMIILIVWLIAYSMIFYVSKFYDSPDTVNFQGYAWYLLYTYDILFATWETGTPPNQELLWINVLFLVFTILFPVVLFNLLVAIITDIYNDEVENYRAKNSKLKLENVLEILELRYFVVTLFFGRPKGEQADLLKQKKRKANKEANKEAADTVVGPLKEMATERGIKERHHVAIGCNSFYN